MTKEDESAITVLTNMGFVPVDWDKLKAREIEEENRIKLYQQQVRAAKFFNGPYDFMIESDESEADEPTIVEKQR